MPLLDGQTYLIRHKPTSQYIVNRQPLSDHPEEYPKVITERWNGEGHHPNSAKIKVLIHDGLYSFNSTNRFFIAECDYKTPEGNQHAVWKEEPFQWNLGPTDRNPSLFSLSLGGSPESRFADIGVDAQHQILSVEPTQPSDGEGPPSCQTSPPCPSPSIPVLTSESNTHEPIWEFIEV